MDILVHGDDDDDDDDGFAVGIPEGGINTFLFLL
jgi:hypothetical protein